LQNISTKSIAEIIHNNIKTYPEEAGNYIKVLSKFVKAKREAGELSLDDDSMT